MSSMSCALVQNHNKAQDALCPATVVNTPRRHERCSRRSYLSGAARYSTTGALSAPPPQSPGVTIHTALTHGRPLQAMHEAASALSASQHRREGVGARNRSACSHNHNTSPAWWRSSPSAMYEGASRYSPAFGSPLTAQTMGASAPATPMTPDDASTAGSRPPASPLGTACPPTDMHKPAQSHTPPLLPPPGPPWGHPRHMPHSRHFRGRPPPPQSGASRLRERACRILRMGETLAIVRPLLYVALLRRFGPRSWLPWTLALACEAIALTMTTLANRILKKVWQTEACIIITGAPLLCTACPRQSLAACIGAPCRQCNRGADTTTHVVPISCVLLACTVECDQAVCSAAAERRRGDADVPVLWHERWGLVHAPVVPACLPYGCRAAAAAVATGAVPPARPLLPPASLVCPTPPVPPRL